MKIKPEHYEMLESEINAVFERYPARRLIEEYETGQFARSEKTKDLQKRFCYDLLYGAGLSSFVCSTLYKYLDDSHVYTALRSICPTVTKRY